MSTSIEIFKPKDAVWPAITDIGESSKMISSIMKIEILDKPKTGIVGLKWRETRIMFGKEATEVMWVTDSVENEYYCTRAESHGSVYISRLSLIESKGVSTLTMSFAGEPQTFIAKLLSAIMSKFMKNSMVKELKKDLNDIKNHVEQS